MMKFVCVFVAVATLLGVTSAEQCISCDSGKDVRCAQDPKQLSPETCKTAENKGCYMRIVDKRVLRGCADELDKEVLEKCLNDKCETCSSLEGAPVCNGNPYPAARLTCHICNGTLESSCFHAAINKNPVICPEYDENDKCFIHKTAKGVERGCLSSSGVKCNNAKDCFTCSGHGCNHISADDPQVPLSSSAVNAFPTLFLTAVTFLTVCFIN